MDLVYIGNDRYYNCWFCNEWYNGLDQDLHKLTPEEVTTLINSVIDKMKINSDK